MIFAPTHPLCHMAYECGAVAHKKVFSFRWSKNSSVYLEIPSLSHMDAFAPGPFAAGSTWFFLQPGRTVRNRSSSFLEELFLLLFCKKKRGPSPLFSFFSSCLSFFLSERVAHALLTGEGILLAHLPSTNVILERVSLCRPVPEKHLV